MISSSRGKASRELALIDGIRARLACVLTECGFAEVACACRNETPVPDGDLRATVEAMVRNVIRAQKRNRRVGA
jgi:hypothetical protein